MIILLGIPGSGKTTQGKLLAKNLNCSWLSVGEALRNSVGPKYQEELKMGHLLGDDIVTSTLEKELVRLGGKDHELILDGCPRTIHQAQWLLEKSRQGIYKITAVVHLHAAEEVVLVRLKNRGRSDDQEQVIKDRFVEYRKVIVPIIDLMKEDGIPVYDIDADGDEASVDAQIMKSLGK